MYDQLLMQILVLPVKCKVSLPSNGESWGRTLLPGELIKSDFTFC